MTETVLINGRPFRVVGEGPGPVIALAKVKRKAHRMIPRALDGQPVTSGTLTLSMAPPSVNSLFHNRAKGRGRTLAYRNWRAFADRELRDQSPWHVPGKVTIIIRSPGRSDPDNRSKAVLDALVGCGRIADDSPKYVIDCRSIHDPTITGTLIEIAAYREICPAQARADAA